MWTMKCLQCDAMVQRNQMPFHIRDVHGPKGPRVQNAPVSPARQPPPTATGSQQWEAFRAREAPPPPDVQEDRGSFRMDVQKMVREFDALPIEAIEECCQSIENMPALPVSPPALYRSVALMIRVRHCMRTPLRTLNFVLPLNKCWFGC